MKIYKWFVFTALTAASIADALQPPPEVKADGDGGTQAKIHAQTSDPVLVGAGDIGECSATRDEATAALLNSIPGTIFTLGDNVYPDGTASQFSTCFGASWGRHKTRIRPSPGNHDYHTAGAAGYFGYFGTAASPLDSNCKANCKGYYSYNLGSWHIIALNSEVDFKPGSAQNTWLKNDLTANKAACTLAYWHKPLFSSGFHGNVNGIRPIWDLLYQYGADVVINGHDHDYERFAPQDPTGKASTRGIRQFVAGTGGIGLGVLNATRPNSEVRNNTTWGVLKLTLHSGSYDWQFVPVAGQTFSDSGQANCLNNGGGAPPPPPPDPPSADTIFKDSFESGSLSAWTLNFADGGDLSVKAATGGKASLGTKQLNVLIDDNNPLFVLDGSPSAERVYRARFYFDPNSIPMPSGNTFPIFMGFMNGAGNMFRIEFGRGQSVFVMRLWAMTDAGTWSFSPWIGITDAIHSVEILWKAATASGANNGVYTLWVDGVPRVQIVSIDNDTRRIDEVRLGAPANIMPTTRGTVLMDAFESRRQSYIGPLP